MSKGFQVSSTLQPPAVEPRVGRALAIALGGMVRGRALALAIRGALLTLVCDAKNGASVQDQARGVLRGRMVRSPLINRARELVGGSTLRSCGA